MAAAKHLFKKQSLYVLYTIYRAVKERSEATAAITCAFMNNNCKPVLLNKTPASRAHSAADWEILECKLRFV